MPMLAYDRERGEYVVELSQQTPQSPAPAPTPEPAPLPPEPGEPAPGPPEPSDHEEEGEKAPVGDGGWQRRINTLTKQRNLAREAIEAKERELMQARAELEAMR